ncbi:ABC transporter substrate-binding protein [Desulfococcaceae bacterium HSG8]|nr:ABC transporter substrate-binding protein [Desulfococcaceae bacterium HSG8]
MAKLKSVFLLTVVVLFICSCEQNLLKKRAEIALNAKGDIVFGIVETSTSPSFFLEGISLAVSEINQRGGLLGRQIKTVIYDDEGDIGKGQSVATSLSNNPDVIAVIGHLNSDVAIPASITYGKNGVIFISPGATHPNLTRYGDEYVFRNITTDENTARQTAEFVSAMEDFKKGVIFYERGSGDKSLAEIFHEQIVEKGVEIVATRSYFGWQKDFRAVLSLLKKEVEFEGIFIAGRLPAAAHLIKQIRDMEITAPIIGGSGLDSTSLWTIAGKAAQGTVVPTVFDPNYPGKTTRTFIDRFEARFGFGPDTWAAQGYDAVSVLAAAIESSGTSVPLVAATTLRFFEDWRGVTGPYSFTREGDIAGKDVFFKKMSGGKFVFLPRMKKKEGISLFDYVVDFTLRLPLEGVITAIDPGFTHDPSSTEVSEQLFLGLTNFDPNTYEAVPELATEWEVSPDGKTYTFELRDDVVWTDGNPVMAKDVVWAIQRNIRPENKCPAANMLYILENAEAINAGELNDMSALGVRAADEKTLEFRLTHPAPYFPALAGLDVYRPLPQRVIEEHGEKWTDPEKIVVNGPYKPALWERGMVMILQKNIDFYDKKNVRIPEVRYYIVQQSSMGLAMYESNDLDVMGSSYLRIPMMEMPRIRQNPVLRKEYYRKPQFCTYAYGFNVKKPLVDNPLIRKAIAAATDRQLLIEIITMGGEEVATTFTRPPTFGAVDPSEGIGIRFNPSQARRLLTQAGYPDGEGFPKDEITLLYNISETHEKLAKAIKTCLKYYLNIDIKLEGKEWKDYVESITGKNPPHIFRSGWCGDYPDANHWLNELFHPSKGMIGINWENKEFAELMEMAQTETDPEKRKAFYKRAEQIMCEEEAAVIPIYFETGHCLVKPRLKGWYHMALGGQHIRNWYFEE